MHVRVLTLRPIGVDDQATAKPMWASKYGVNHVTAAHVTAPVLADNVVFMGVNSTLYAMDTKSVCHVMPVSRTQGTRMRPLRVMVT